MDNGGSNKDISSSDATSRRPLRHLPSRLCRLSWFSLLRRPAQGFGSTLPSIDIPHQNDFTALKKLLQRKADQLDAVIAISDINNFRSLLALGSLTDIAKHFDDRQDAENLIKFIIHVLDNKLICNTDLKAANSRARQLAIKLGMKLNAIPKCFFLDPDEVSIQNEFPVGSGGFAVVYKGTYRGAKVALKCVRNREIDRDFCREAIAWRTLSHKYILPFIGIFVSNSPRFVSLVAPFMENGTLSQWREENVPTTAEIKKFIKEVAEGLQYLHSEGVVHGDIRGSNVLIGPDFHVRIADFGLVRHLDGTATKNDACSYRFAAPELLGGEEGLDTLKRTDKTDVYAFGCLYYEIHFGCLPFCDSSTCSVILRVKGGRRPVRLESPPLDENGWRLIQRCWNQDATKRPNIEDVLHTI